MSKKSSINERAVIERYEECETARIVAQEFGVSDETIYRILRRNGIQRTHRHSKNRKRERDSNCRSKYCPALVVMLRTVCNFRNKEICSYLGMKPAAVGNIISKHGLANKKHRRDIDMDILEAEYLTGASTYELGEKYGVAHQTIGKWMQQRGHFRGKEYGSKKGTEVLKQRAIKKLQNKVKEDTGGSVVLVEFCGDTSKFKCNDCGAEFSLWRNYRGYKISCPKCREEEIKLRKEQREKEHEETRKQTEQARAEEYAKDKICVSCGGVFHSEYKAQKYCCATCSRREKRHRDIAAGKHLLVNYGNHRKRARIYGVAYEPGITVKKLIKRDNNICQICGEPCDSNDHRWSENFGPLYPTIDHIIAMANGGSHTWGNVQLAHAICNSVKRDLTEEELTEEMITHAKEQAIADKCA